MFKKCALKVKILAWERLQLMPGQGRQREAGQRFPRLMGFGAEFCSQGFILGFYLANGSEVPFAGLAGRGRGQAHSEILSIKQMGQNFTHHSNQACESQFLADLKLLS